MSLTTAPLSWRIGTLAERVGVSEHVLRAWEKRYGLLQPARSAGGYRMYGPEDERRALAMVAARRARVPAALAAAGILAGAAHPVPRGDAEQAWSSRVSIDALHAAAAAYDGIAAQHTLDRLLVAGTIATAMSDVVLPFLSELGSGWEAGRVCIAQEHFASELVRGWLGSLTSDITPGRGPVAVLACPPGERHDIALKAMEVVLLQSGWRVRFLGADTPFPALSQACRTIAPDAVVLAATRRTALEAHGPVLRRLAATVPLFIGGPGAHEDLVADWGVTRLSGDLVAAARQLSRSVSTHPRVEAATP